jgi:hypothetical protein
MGFSTTMTTQLKSVGDAIQIVGLLIGGTIILNVPNCECPQRLQRGNLSDST